MKSFRSKQGPFSERPFFSDSELETICREELNAQGLLPQKPEAIRIERFAEKRFQVTVEPRDLGDGILGLTEFGDNGVEAIYISEALDAEGTQSSERRVRSTIAHEAGHGLLHTHLFAVSSQTRPLFGDFSDPKTPKVLCRDGDINGESKRYRGDWWEYQANAAMGNLLIPRFLIAPAIEQFLVPAGQLGGQQINPNCVELAVRHLAEVFNVNPALARIRLESAFPTAKTKQMML